MSSMGSVTAWIEQLRAGNRAAAQRLWERYFSRLVGLARRKLQGLRRGAADEEDVALSAFDSFCRGAEQGRFPRLDDRHDLWQVLLVLTQRKVADLAQHEGREKRDWRRAEPIESADPPGAALVARDVNRGPAQLLPGDRRAPPASDPQGMGGPGRQPAVRGFAVPRGVPG